MKGDFDQYGGSCADSCCCPICLGFDVKIDSKTDNKLKTAIEALKRIEAGRFLDADRIARKALKKIKESDEQLKNHS